ncbi:MAG: right-handed parallel beta-helix repeat-containing protein, partial [Mesorhizobium sp.]
MKVIRFFLSLAVLLLASVFLIAPASAQTRTWVSGVGDDVNPCSRT